MRLTIKTSKLQDMVSKVINCSSNNKLIPLTSLMSIKVEGGRLTLTTTDATNYFYVSMSDAVECEDFEIAVLADLFTKLIQKMTCEDTILTISGNTLEIKGNGTYTMELPLDEAGRAIKFPNKLPDTYTAGKTISKKDVEKVINYNKNSLATSVTLPSICCYYCGDAVITTDQCKACSTDIQLFNTPTLVSPQLMQLLSVMSGAEIEVELTENAIVYESGYDTIYAPIIEGVNTFPATALQTLLDGEFTSECVVDKNDLLSLLNRILLFVGSYDNKGVYLTFTSDGILVSTKKSSGSELIKYATVNNFKDYTCVVDIEMFKSQIETQESDTVKIAFGSPIAIKLISDTSVEIIALADDDRG